MDTKYMYMTNLTLNFMDIRYFDRDKFYTQDSNKTIL